MLRSTHTGRAHRTDVLAEEVFAHISTANGYVLMSDGSQDRSTTEQEVIYSRTFRWLLGVGARGGVVGSFSIGPAANNSRARSAASLSRFLILKAPLQNTTPRVHCIFLVMVKRVIHLGYASL